jgi:hypothetical protein
VLRHEYGENHVTHVRNITDIETRSSPPPATMASRSMT